MNKRQRLERMVEEMTQARNGQFPRPWMTDMTRPERARVFIVGLNQATGMMPGNQHGIFADALFNRNGETCRSLYDRITGERGPSRARPNVERLTEVLGIAETLDTNVVCYASPMGSDPGQPAGAAEGTALFMTLLDIVRPPVLIVHGSGTRQRLGLLLGAELPPLPEEGGAVAWARVSALDGGFTPAVYVIPSLAPPVWNRWSGWAEAYFQELAAHVRGQLGVAAKSR